MGDSSSSSSPKSSIMSPGWSFLRTAELKKRNSAGSPTTRPNSRPGMRSVGAFFHAERHDRQRLERRRECRGRRAWRFRCRCNRCAACRRGCARPCRRAPAHNTPRRARPRASDLRRSRLDWLASLLPPARYSSTPSIRSRTSVALQHAAVEEHVRRAGKTAGPAPHGALLGWPRLLAEEARQVPSDGGIGRVGQPDFLQRRRGAACAGISLLATAGKKPSPSTCVDIAAQRAWL